MKTLSLMTITMLVLSACGVSRSLYNDNTNDAGVTNDATTPDAQDRCGDGVLDPGETCDTFNFGGQDCHSLGFFAGSLSCNPDCTANTTLCVNESEYCGNSVLDPGEDCDGLNLGGQDCTDFAFFAGSLSCNPDCTVNTTLCETSEFCGNSVLDPGEDCDASNLGGLDCVDYGFVAGSLSCNPDCTADVTLCEAPELCGDGTVQTGENCDYANDPDCYLDCSGSCGDGLLHDGVQYPDHGEECDGSTDCTEVCTITTCGDGYCTASEEDCVEDCGCAGAAVECNGVCCDAGYPPLLPGACCSDGMCIVFTGLGVANCGICGNTCAGLCVIGVCQ